MTPSFFMQLALNEAWRYQGLTYPNPAVGCAVTGSRGELLSIAAHKRAGTPHAEVAALQNAYSVLTGDTAITELDNASEIHNYLIAHHAGCFNGCTLYVTLEPCSHSGRTPSCAGLLAVLKPASVVIACADEKGDGSGGSVMLEAAGIEVVSGICKEEGEALLLPFLRWREEHFVCFKWAQRLDGTVDGGIISSEASRRQVHAMRDCCDLLVIGGNTVREDRPVLDARMVEGRAPDVLIYSKSDDFDRSIPLFGVEGRKVFIDDSFECIENYNNILIEGGPGMFEATKSLTDCYLAFVAPKSGGTIPFTKSTGSFKFLHTSREGDDLTLWLKGN